MGKHYEWQRFWHPSDTEPRLTEDGFLYDRDSLVAKMLGSKLFTLSELAAHPCLILLGQPGSGKSTEVATAFAAVEAGLSDADVAMFVQLRDIDSRAAFKEKVQDTAVFRAWLEGGYRLTLFLDSLDEGLLGFATLSTTIAEFLENLPTERLHFRLVSRTADWPKQLTEAIAARWRMDWAQSLTLAPLRLEDVQSAALAEGIAQPDHLISAIRDRHAGSLATRPVALRLLLTTYQHHGTLARSRRALYNNGCLLLATEESASRQASRRTGALEAEERLAIAARIAFVLMFANRSSVWVDADYGDIPSSDVRISDLLGGRRETAGGVRIALRREHVLEVLHCALFAAKSGSRIGFAHQTFAEHLAAWYIWQHRLAWEQVRSIMFSRQRGAERIVPQLHETAARAAEYGIGLLRHIAARDPDVVLKATDIGSRSQRASLVDALLERSRADNVAASAGYTNDILARLDHPQLAVQLQPVLSNAKDHTEARKFAADLAGACRCSSLANVLATIALDASEPFLLRYDAIVALARLAVASATQRMVPIAVDPPADDDDDLLKGTALSLTWPDFLSAEQLFGALSTPKRSNLSGTYQRFLADLGASLSRDDLPTALSWARQHAMADGYVGTCVSGILRRAWEHIDLPEVLAGFSAIAYDRLRQYRPIVADEREGLLNGRHHDEPSFAEQLADDTTRRRLLAERLLNMADDREVITLLHSEQTILAASDIEWVVARLAGTHEASRRRTLIAAVRMLFYSSRAPEAAYEPIFRVAQTLGQDDLRHEFADFLDGIVLDSPRATELRDQQASMLKWQQRKDDDRPAYPPTLAKIVSYLDRFDAGESEAWWYLCTYLARNAEGTLEDRNYIAVDRQAGWQLLDAGTEERVVGAASGYVRVWKPKLDEWVGKNLIYHPDLAGIRALHLLYSRERSRLPSERDQGWAIWGPAMIAQTVYDSRDHDADQVLLARAFRAAPDALWPVLAQVIRNEDGTGHGLFALSRLEQMWLAGLGERLLSFLGQMRLSARSTEQLLHELLARDVEGAQDYASELFSRLKSPDDGERQLVFVAARALIRSSSALGHSLIWPAMQADANFGRDLLLSLAENRDWLIPNILATWGEYHVGELYLWLEHQFPSSQDPNPETVFSPWPRYNIGHWRRQLLNALEHAGTWEAVQALQRIYEELPWPGHAYALRDGRAAAWRSTWQPPAPAHLLRMIDSTTVRLVRDGHELLRVVNESLYRFQGELIGTTPLVRTLWHPLPWRRWRPRDEGELADALERHLVVDLKTRGIVAGREVVIRRGAGDGVSGSRTDITVFAVTPGSSEHSFDSVSIVLEVKCSWSPDVLTALDVQLVGDYLQNNQRTRHGIYVVGWYDSPVWDPRDQRRKRNFGQGLQALLVRVQRQARAASQRGLYVLAGVLDVSLERSMLRPTRPVARKARRTMAP